MDHVLQNDVGEDVHIVEKAVSKECGVWLCHNGNSRKDCFFLWHKNKKQRTVIILIINFVYLLAMMLRYTDVLIINFVYLLAMMLRYTDVLIINFVYLLAMMLITGPKEDKYGLATHIGSSRTAAHCKYVPTQRRLFITTNSRYNYYLPCTVQSSKRKDATTVQNWTGFITLFLQSDMIGPKNPLNIQ